MLISKMFKHTHTILGIAVFSVALTTAAFAQMNAEAPPPVDILPAASLENQGESYDGETHTHPPIKLTPDKSELLRLEGEAGSIIIGNPTHLSILADSADLLVLVPRAPGATHFTILDREGNVMMQRHAIIASPKEKYIRIRNTCAGNSDCQQTEVYYCPDMCHAIALGGNAEAASSDSAGNGDNISIEALNINTNDPGEEPSDGE